MESRTIPGYPSTRGFIRRSRSRRARVTAQRIHLRIYPRYDHPFGVLCEGRFQPLNRSVFPSQATEALATKYGDAYRCWERSLRRFFACGRLRSICL